MNINRISQYRRVVYFIILIFFIAVIPLFVSSPYYLDLTIIAMVHAILAMTFIMMLRTGLINLGIGAFWGLGAYISTILVMKLDLSYWAGLPLSVFAVAAISFCLGLIMIGKRAKGLTFVLLSAVIGMLFSVSIGSISYLGGWAGIIGIPKPDPIRLPFLPNIEFASKVEFFYLALTILILVIFIFGLFYSSRIGRAWRAIGINSHLAESIGVDIFKYKLLAFVLSSSIAGLVGSFYAHYQGFIMPDSFNMFVNINIQINAVIGGLAYGIMGPIVGATLMTFLPEMLRGTEVIAPLISGAILVLLILFLPGGLISLLENLLRVFKMGFKKG